MKLYYSPGACSLACHIALEEAGLKYQIEKVDLKTKKTEKGNDFYKANPKGYVPTLEISTGEFLTEGAVIMQFIADQKPEKNLFPKTGTMDRYHAQEWLNFVATEIHKGFSPLWNPKIPEAYQAIVKENLAKKFDFLATHFAKNTYLTGKNFTVADGYLFTCLEWAHHVKIDLTKWPKIMGFMETVKNRPAVRKVFDSEGIKTAV